MDVIHSLQGHLLSGKQWIMPINKISSDELGFKTTTHHRCVHTRTDAKGTTLATLRQIDVFLIGTNNQVAAERLTKRIGKKVKHKLEEELSIKFFGSAKDCNGSHITWRDNSISMSSKSDIERMLKTHCCDVNCPKPCKDRETDGHLVSPVPVDCLSRMCLGEGCTKKGMVEHATLEKKQ